MITSTEWRERVAAEQRYAHLAATVEIIIGELCHVGENSPADVSERIYGCTKVLEDALKGSLHV